MDEYNNLYDPFQVCFNILKMKYADYDESLSSKNLLNKYDKINVFINLETVFKNLSLIQDLERKIVMQRDFDIIITANILNLVAHYKRFFVNNTFDTKVYIYNTDFASDNFNQYKYNEDFRSYYLTKFNANPKFTLLTEKLRKYILPDVKTYCEFIPNVYYVNATNIEGSLVPFIIGNSLSDRKNIIIGGELYDTQYSILPNFINYYIHRGFNVNAIYSDLNGYIKDISKENDKEELDDFNNTFDTYQMYCTLMSVLGDKHRSIDGITGCGIKTLKKLLKEGKMENIIQESTNTPELIGNIFHDGEIKKEFINNFYCSSILNMYDELTEADKNYILNQITIDRNDTNSFSNLNNTKFYNHKLLLEGLLI